MPLFSEEEVPFIEAVSRLSYCNPFLPERIRYEREALGAEFVESGADWNIRAGRYDARQNLSRIMDRAESLSEAVHKRLKDGVTRNARELALYQDLALFLIYHRYADRIQDVINRSLERNDCVERFDFYSDFQRETKELLFIPGITFQVRYEVPHLFSIFFQFRRAFHHIFMFIVGGSKASMRLRAAVWQSIFTHDLKLYERQLYKMMGDMTTLITGPSGTGKELVARAIGMSRYIPFSEKSMGFEEDFTRIFHPLNISALSPTLIESELFGHKKGTFTGAMQDRVGWLEACSSYGSVFLDEVGEIDPIIQVKLLRVLQERTFQRLGETKERVFKGKIMAATNRNLSEEINSRGFRKDFYYRLCSDMVTTPALFDQLQDDKNELYNLVLHITKRLIGGGAEALAGQAVRWIEKNLGAAYPWPGNIRELEQCVRNIIIRNEYRPPEPGNKATSSFQQEVADGKLTAEELLNRYCDLVYAQTKSYEETARRIGLDRRTVRKRVVGKM